MQGNKIDLNTLKKMFKTNSSPGRRPKDEHEKRTSLIKTYLTSEENEMLNEYAKKSKVKKSAFVRDAILEKLQKEKNGNSYGIEFQENRRY